jgi:hypothetical protein
LIRLGNIGKDDIDHGDNHAVADGLTGILDNGHNVGSLGSHGNEITARAVRELNSVDETGRANKVGNVRDRGTRGSTKVQNARTGTNVDVIRTTSNGSAKLASEGVPKSVLDLGGRGRAVVVLDGLVNADALLAVDRLAGVKVTGCYAVFLSTTDDKDTGVTMGLLISQSQVSLVSLLRVV